MHLNSLLKYIFVFLNTQNKSIALGSSTMCNVKKKETKNIIVFPKAFKNYIIFIEYIMLQCIGEQNNFTTNKLIHFFISNKILHTVFFLKEKLKYRALKVSALMIKNNKLI